MGYTSAQLRYDAMTDEHPDDDIYDADLETLQDALELTDCDYLSGRRYAECERRAKLIKARIKELMAEVA